MSLYSWLYRGTMKASHRFNWHHTRTLYPEGDTMLVCDWCGLRYVSHRAGYKPVVSISEQQRAAKTGGLPR